MIVMKFGGSSLTNSGNIKNVAEIIEENRDRHPVVVISALGGTTDDLLQLKEHALAGHADICMIRERHDSILDELGIVTQPEGWNDLWDELNSVLLRISFNMDRADMLEGQLLSIGERLAAKLLAALLNDRGLPSVSYDAWDVGFIEISDKLVLNNPDLLNRIYNCLHKVTAAESPIPVITGYIARKCDGKITTLGRNGSDLTASLIGAALKVNEIQYWKDVDGIMTADPKKVNSAKHVPLISFQEASELAFFGSKILHPSSIKPAWDNGIPISIKNTAAPDRHGTTIVLGLPDESPGIKAITSKRNVTLVDITSLDMVGQYGFLARVFEIFRDLKLSVDLMATSEVSVSLSLDEAHSLPQLKDRLEKFSRVNILSGKAIISLIGHVSQTTSILQQVFVTLNNSHIEVIMISQGMSRANISFVVDDENVTTCIQQLHNCLYDLQQPVAMKSSNINTQNRDTIHA